MSLKITFVTETFPPEVNGVAMTVGRLVSGMRERGHRVDDDEVDGAAAHQRVDDFQRLLAHCRYCPCVSSLLL